VEVTTKDFRQTEEKYIQIGKEEVKPFLFTDEVISHVENPKQTAKALEQIKNLAKFNAHKSVVFQYISNEQHENGIQKDFIYKIIKPNKNLGSLLKILPENFYIFIYIHNIFNAYIDCGKGKSTYSISFTSYTYFVMRTLKMPSPDSFQVYNVL
jgi:hypothetical protein